MMMQTFSIYEGVLYKNPIKLFPWLQLNPLTRSLTEEDHSDDTKLCKIVCVRYIFPYGSA